MDLLLFDRYNLSLTESNPDVIEYALEKKKNESNWVKNLNAKNDRILSKAKEEQARWNNDKYILLNPELRKSASEKISGSIAKVVEYLDDHASDENRFLNAEAAFAELGLKSDDIKYTYDKYKPLFGVVSDPVILARRRDVARQLARTYGEYSKLIQQLDNGIKSKFYELGIDVSTFYSALSFSICTDSADVGNNAEKLSVLSYEIYNRKLLKDTEKNAFMDIFSRNSNAAFALARALEFASFDDFRANRWILFKYISLTCRFMDSSTVNIASLEDIPSDEQKPFADALKKIFGVKVEGAVNRSGYSVNNSVPSEVNLGNAELAKGDFPKAYGLFKIAVDKDPYCWQGYWGMFKASSGSKTDNDACFPGFINSYTNYLNGTERSDLVDLYVRAKENASAQKTRDINFYDVERKFREADRELEGYAEYGEILQSNYENINENEITNSKFKQAMQDFRQKAEVYKDHFSYVEGSFLFTAVLMVIGLAFITFSVFSFYKDPDSLIPIVLAIVLIPSLAMGFFVYNTEFSIVLTILGVFATGIVFGILAFLSYSLVGAIGVFGSIIILLLSIGFIYLAIRRIIKRQRLKKGLPLERKEAYDIVSNTIINCYFEDLREYYDSRNLSRYRIIPISKINFQYGKYLEIWEITPEMFDSEAKNKPVSE